MESLEFHEGYFYGMERVNDGGGGGVQRVVSGCAYLSQSTFEVSVCLLSAMIHGCQTANR